MLLPADKVPSLRIERHRSILRSPGMQLMGGLPGLEQHYIGSQLTFSHLKDMPIRGCLRFRVCGLARERLTRLSMMHLSSM